MCELLVGIGDTLLFLLVFCGPLPLAVVVAWQIDSGPSTDSQCLRLVSGIFTWLIVQSSLALIAAGSGLYRSGVILAAETLLLAVGMAIRVRTRIRLSGMAITANRVPATGFSVTYIILIILFLSALSSGVWCLTHPVTESDSLSYHLPVIAASVQAGRYTPLDQFSSSQISHYPFTWELLSGLFILPLHTDMAVTVINLIAWLLLGGSIFLLARKTEAEPVYAVIGTALVLTLPIVRRNINTMHVDLALAASFLAGLALLLNVSSRRVMLRTGILLASIGLLAGIKMSGLLYGGLLIAYWLATSAGWTRNLVSKTELTRQRRTVDLFLFVGGLAAFAGVGGFFYLRNLIETGNPIGFLQISIGSRILFPGPVDFTGIRMTTLANCFNPQRAGDWMTLWGQVMPHLHLPFLSLVALMLCSIPVLIHPVSRYRRRPAVFFLFITATTLLLYTATPYSGDNGSHDWLITPWIGQAFRFAFPFLGLLGVIAAWTASVLHLRAEFLAMLVVASSLSGMTGRMLTATAATFCICILFLSWWHSRSRPSFNRTLKRLMLIVSCLVLIIFLAGPARTIRSSNRFRFFGRNIQKIEKALPISCIVGYISSDQSYLLYGPRFTRRIVHAPSKYRHCAAWYRDLIQQKIQYLALGPQNRTWSKCREWHWLRDDSDRFEAVIDGNPESRMVLFRVRNPEERTTKDEDHRSTPEFVKPNPPINLHPL